MSTATDMVALYIDAEKKVLQGKTVSIGGRSMSRENLNEIRAGRREWENKVNSEKAKSQGGSSLYSVADWR